MCGSYADMNAGSPAEALMDFTGGIHVGVELSEPPQNLWELMLRAGQAKALMSSGTPQGVSAPNREPVTPEFRVNTQKVVVDKCWIQIRPRSKQQIKISLQRRGRVM